MNKSKRYNKRNKCRTKKRGGMGIGKMVRSVFPSTTKPEIQSPAQENERDLFDRIKINKELFTLPKGKDLVSKLKQLEEKKINVTMEYEGKQPITYFNGKISVLDDGSGFIFSIEESIGTKSVGNDKIFSFKSLIFVSNSPLSI